MASESRASSESAESGASGGSGSADGASGDGNGSQGRAQEAESNVVFPWMLRFVSTDTVEVARIASCFSSPMCVRKVMKDVAVLMDRVEQVEPLHLESTRIHFTHLLQFLYARPSRENGSALMRWIDCVRRSLDFRHSWPKEPLKDERLGTMLEGVEQIMILHPKEGLIRLHWMNPLPTPAWLQHGGYQCDICFNPDLRTGYQHVNEDNARDHSKLLEQRTGYDACAKCAVETLVKNRKRIHDWSFNAALQRGVPVSDRRCETGEEQLSLSVSPRVAHGSLDVEIEVQGSIGHHVAVAALPMDCELPAAWLGTGRKVLRQAEIPRSAAEPSCKVVQFRCLKSDTLFRFAPGENRGCLRCWALLRNEQTFGAEHSIQAVSCVERSTEGGTVRLAWRKGPAGEGATIPAEQLEALRLLATWAGCLHNLPPPSTAGAGPTSAASAKSDAAEALRSFERQGPGVKGAFLQAPELEAVDCAICLGGLCEQTWVRGAPVKTRCGHYFHALCLRRHLRASVNEATRPGQPGVCPNCRAPEADSASSCGQQVQRWRIEEDTQGRALGNGPYRFLAVLCTDPEAVVDSSVVMQQITCTLEMTAVSQPSLGYTDGGAGMAMPCLQTKP